ncbi:MAG: hypothetical protein ACI9KE_002664 [Polyangiales bacterium]|jgi:hypothetical protein
MAHRFLHTLVFSSAIALEGCSTSHSSPPDLPDGAMPDALSLDAGSALDTGPPPFDGGRPSIDGGNVDTGSQRDAGNDAGRDAGPTMDPRLCEPGWQTTKASTCQPIDMDDPESPLICYSSFICEPVENEAGDLVEECREWEEADGGCLLQRAEWPRFVEVDP